MLPIKSSVIALPERNIYLPEKSIRELPCSEDIYLNVNDIETFENALSLNERPSPVGGESIEDEFNIGVESKNTSKITHNFDSEEDWSDWDNTNRRLTFEPSSPTDDDIIDKPFIENNLLIDINSTQIVPDKKDTHVSRTLLLQKAALQAKKNIVDISELDIKNQKAESTRKEADEFDFFADMTPVIEKPSIAEVTSVSEQQGVSSNLDFIPNESVDESDAWGENWND